MYWRNFEKTCLKKGDREKGPKFLDGGGNFILMRTQGVIWKEEERKGWGGKERGGEETVLHRG